jgi:hypothetical protein
VVYANPEVKLNIIMHRHHIIPKHMGGTDDVSNIVELSVEDHAEAHRKLYEQHGHWEDELAYKALSGQIGKEEIILERQREGGRRVKSDEEKAKLSKSLTGRKLSAEHRANISKGGMGRQVTAETRAKLSEANTGYKHTPEAIAKMSGENNHQHGKKHSAERKAQISESMKAYKKAIRDDS